MALRCANCGQPEIFDRWFAMVDRCPRCALRFERQPGYWLGAMILNFAFTAAAFLAVFLATLFATWPDPPWTTIWVVSMVVAVAAPFAVFPWTRMLFSAMELGVRPPEPDEQGSIEAR